LGSGIGELGEAEVLEVGCNMISLYWPGLGPGTAGLAALRGGRPRGWANHDGATPPPWRGRCRGSSH